MDINVNRTKKYPLVHTECNNAILKQCSFKKGEKTKYKKRQGSLPSSQLHKICTSNFFFSSLFPTINRELYKNVQQRDFVKQRPSKLRLIISYPNAGLDYRTSKSHQSPPKVADYSWLVCLCSRIFFFLFSTN